jgi:hypothetical protein
MADNMSVIRTLNVIGHFLTDIVKISNIVIILSRKCYPL